MRVLATIGFSFSAGVFLAALLPWDGWQLYAAAGAALLALVWLLAARRSTCFRRGLLILLPLAVSLAYFAGYRYLVQRPVEQRCGAVSPFTATVCDWPQETERGCRITVKLDGYPGARAVLYGESELLDARPGNTLAGTAQWQSAAHIHNNELTHFTARGVYALLYGREDVQLSEGSEGTLRWLPQRAAKAFRERIAAVWDDPRVSGFLTAELTGDKSAMDEGDYLAMQETGLAHLFAVSGLHCAFLVTLLSLLVSRRRRLLCAVTIPALLFYMVMVGLSPSVVRACIMQMFLLVAPLFRRNSDPLTSLAAALLVILLVNPFAAASVSLQLSFSATLGMVLLSPRLYRGLTGWYKGKNRVLRHGLCFVMANLAATLSAVVFTAPLTAYYFRIFVLVAPLSSLLAVPAAGWSFMTAFVTALLGFVWLPLARILGALYWLLFVYTAFIGCAVTPDGRRKYAVASVLSVVTLIAAIWVNQQSYRYGALSALALDVGQGESVILWSQDETALVDCGSSNSYKDPGGTAADTLHSMGVTRLSAVVVTHYHADHTNGLYEVLRRVPVDKLYLPDIEDEYGVRERLTALAEEKDVQVVWVTDTVTCPLGQAILTVYPPVQSGGDLNELGLTALATSGDFDLLITGDMSGSTERKLAETYPLPDVEVLVVSHHGSRYSSDIRFLQAVTPEAAVISVGDNSYGHPSEETVQRLLAVGAEIWRTDRQGNIRITVNGG